MVRRITVLVTGVGGCGVGEGIFKALLMCEPKYRIVACNMHADAPALFRAASAYIVPRASDFGYIETILNICRSEKVDIVVPGSEPETLILSEKRRALGKAGVSLIANPPSVVKIGEDKWLTHRFLASNGFGTPVSSLVPVADTFWRHVSFPVIVKPRCGNASKNVFVVESRSELELVLSYLKTKCVAPIVQEKVGAEDEEYTVSVLVAKRTQVLASIAMRRRLLGGFSQWVEVEDYSKIRTAAENVCVRLGASGPVNLQCRLVNGECKFFEINCRFSGTTPFRAMVGFNEVDMLIKYTLFGVRPSVNIMTGRIGLRGFEEVLLEQREYQAVLNTKSLSARNAQSKKG